MTTLPTWLAVYLAFGLTLTWAALGNAETVRRRMGLASRSWLYCTFAVLMIATLWPVMIAGAIIKLARGR